MCPIHSTYNTHRHHFICNKKQHKVNRMIIGTYTVTHIQQEPNGPIQYLLTISLLVVELLLSSFTFSKNQRKRQKISRNLCAIYAALFENTIFTFFPFRFSLSSVANAVQYVLAFVMVPLNDQFWCAYLVSLLTIPYYCSLFFRSLVFILSFSILSFHFLILPCSQIQVASGME